MSEEKKGIQSKYVKSPNGRIFLNNKNLSVLSDMSAIDVQGFEDPIPETVDQLNAMIADALKNPKKADAGEDEDEFDFSKSTKLTIAKKAKELFDIELDIKDKDIKDIRIEYEILTKTIGANNGDTGTGSN